MDNNELLLQIAQLIEEQTRHIDLKIESEVTKRLDALVDGYKGNYEKQEELAQDLEDVKRRVDRLENIAG